MDRPSLDEILSDCPKDEIIANSFIKAWAVINSPAYKKIVCSISGGSDSDIILDICQKCDTGGKIDYVWFDTGLEYQATKDHLKYLEDKYKIKVKTFKALKPIPISCREYGEPFISKMTSEYIGRLQKHGFQWEDDTFDHLLEKYPNCKTALKWWCSLFGDGSNFNISRNKFLKEFMKSEPPNFKISKECCEYAKKKVANEAIKGDGCNLNILGIRRAEGGQRISVASCFSEGIDDYDIFRPIFWYKNEQKRIYEEHYGITHSKCYTEYGLKRTGCAGCPFGNDFEHELEAIRQHEPKLFAAVNNIFRESYEYTRKYREFVRAMESDECEGQMSIFDYLGQEEGNGEE